MWGGNVSNVSFISIFFKYAFSVHWTKLVEGYKLKTLNNAILGDSLNTFKRWKDWIRDLLLLFLQELS